LGLEGKPGLGEEPLDQSGPVLNAVEPVLDDSGELGYIAGPGVTITALYCTASTSGGAGPPATSANDRPALSAAARFVVGSAAAGGPGQAVRCSVV
jgi:hypothetical protein